MPIDIHGLPPASLPPSGDKSRVKDGQQPSAPASPARAADSTQSDTVSLTDTAARLAELDRALANVPVVDAQRVEEVKQAISEGRYQIDPAKVADKLLSFETALSGKPKT